MSLGLHPWHISHVLGNRLYNTAQYIPPLGSARITDMGDAACQRGDQVCGQPAVKDLSCSLKMCPVPIAHLSKPNTPISLRHVAQTCHNTAPYGRPLYLHCTVGPP